MIDQPLITLVSSGLPILLPQTDRTEGVVHVSSTITDMCYRLGYYNESQDKTIDETLRQLGSTFEWALIQRYQREFPDQYEIPPEINLDGIYGHPDLRVKRKRSNRKIKEIKFTYRSSGKESCSIGSSPSPTHPILSPKFWRDRTQLKTYCRMEECLYGELEICHIKGDYQKDEEGNYRFRVIHNIWSFTWTEEALLDHWRGFLRHVEEYSCPICNRFQFEGHERWCGGGQ